MYYDMVRYKLMCTGVSNKCHSIIQKLGKVYGGSINYMYAIDVPFK